MNFNLRAVGRPAATLLTAVAALAGMTSVAHAADTPTCEQTCLLDFRTGAQDGCDRLVLDLSGPVPTPAQMVQSQAGPDPLTYPASGKTVPIDGSSYMTISISGIDITDVNGANT
ncbi:hypothetical protein POF50_030160 [Streptomyces sp. SL13]|uniref:AMIN-like domain-containing protein n=1 Tax=Streptantibioticus silvisoli TaxID=2705255 RepID=A0AA90H4X4_9ACTN|nr:hypothetical protein [Streptantibioticus silvisoli]MDI5973554.1 hypothetical protein [Streptantibioticus silvisoli]